MIGDLRKCRCGTVFLVSGRNHKWCSWLCRYEHVGREDNRKQRERRKQKLTQNETQVSFSPL